MKKLIQQFRASNELDASNPDGQPGPGRTNATVDADALLEVDRRLRSARTPAPAAPAWLAASIMNAVRQGEDRQDPAPGHRLRAAVAGGFLAAALACGGVWLMVQADRVEGSGWPVAHAEADTAVRTIAVRGGETLLHPLDSELENLSMDLDRATRFLVASIP